MVIVQVTKSHRGFEGMRVIEHAGDPLVCAATSAIMQGLAGTLMNIEPKPNITRMIIQSGLVDIETAPMFDEQDQKIIDTVFFTALISLKQIEQTHPDKLQVV